MAPFVDAISAAASPPQTAPRFDPERARPGHSYTDAHSSPLDTHIIIATAALLSLLLAVLFLNFIIRWLLRRFYRPSPFYDSEAHKPSDAHKGLTKTQLQSLPTIVFSFGQPNLPAAPPSLSDHKLAPTLTPHHTTPAISLQKSTHSEGNDEGENHGEAVIGTDHHLPSIEMVAEQQYDQGSVDACGCPCPICLADFVRGEIIRVLPTCHHRFHSNCIDIWLAKHSSCPACRADLIEATKNLP